MARADRTRPNRTGTSFRRGLTGVVALGLSLGALLVAPGAVAPASAAGGLTEDTRARYEVTAKGKVTAEVTSTITNVTPDQGNRYYYWNSYGLDVPASATGITATSGGYPLTVRVENTDEPSAKVAHVSFSPLRYGRTRTIEWSYRIEGQPFRSQSWTRVGPGYATFGAHAFADPDRTEVEVLAPQAMVFDASTPFDTDQQGKKTLYTLDERTVDGGTWAAVSLRHPKISDTTEVTVDGTTITLHSFRGDTKWAKSTAEQIRTGLPALAGLVGAEWPDNVRAIREDTSPSVLGYGGWFSSDEEDIVVNESLDASLLLHELTHAWINHDSVEDRWLVEGLTEVVAQRAVAATDADGEPRQAPRRGAKLAYPLADWKPAFTLDDDAEAYGYDAAYTAVQALTADMDDAAFSDLVSDTYEGNSAYADPATANQFRGGTTDWKRFFDLVEKHGGSPDAAKTYRHWVLTTTGKERLGERAAARDGYAEYDAADGAWMPPAGLRSAMTGWSFGAVERIQDKLGDAPRLAAEVQDVAEQTGLPVPDAVRTAYESAARNDTYAQAGTTLEQAVGTIAAVGQASDTVAAQQDPFTELGERILEVETTAAASRTALADGELDGADALAAETTEQADRAVWVGAGVVAAAVLLLALLVLVPVLIVRWRRRRRRRAWAPTLGEVFAVVAAPQPEPEPAPAPGSPDVAAGADGTPDDADEDDEARAEAGAERGIDRPVS